MDIVCYKCHKTLDEFGALLFSPPTSELSCADCKKIHICVECYYKVMSLLKNHEESS